MLEGKYKYSSKLICHRYTVSVPTVRLWLQSTVYSELVLLYSSDLPNETHSDADEDLLMGAM